MSAYSLNSCSVALEIQRTDKVKALRAIRATAKKLCRQGIEQNREKLLALRATARKLRAQ